MARAEELIGLLDETRIELLRQIVLGNGSISWPQMQNICGISGTDFGHYYYCYGEKIERALQTVTRGEQRYSITYEVDTLAWDADDWKDVKLDIDDPALTSLREVFAN